MTINSGKKRMHRMHRISHTHHGFFSSAIECAVLINEAVLFTVAIIKATAVHAQYVCMVELYEQ